MWPLTANRSLLLVLLSYIGTSLLLHAGEAAAAIVEFMKRLLWMCGFVPGWSHHNQMSRVFTLKTRTYQVCFECGREFEYSWTRMHVQMPSDRAYVPLHTTKPVQVPGISVAHAISLNS